MDKTAFEQQEFLLEEEYNKEIRRITILTELIFDDELDGPARYHILDFAEKGCRPYGHKDHLRNLDELFKIYCRNKSYIMNCMRFVQPPVMSNGEYSMQVQYFTDLIKSIFNGEEKDALLTLVEPDPEDGYMNTHFSDLRNLFRKYVN